MQAVVKEAEREDTKHGNILNRYSIACCNAYHQSTGGSKRLGFGCTNAICDIEMEDKYRNEM